MCIRDRNAGLYNPQGVGGTHVMYVLKHADKPELEDLPKNPSISPMVSLWKGVAKPLADAELKQINELVKEAMGLFRRADRFTRAKPEPGARRETRQEARALLDDARRLERQAVEHILDTADVLCATLTGLDSELLGTRRFDLAVIDEACQSVEPGCWLPLLRCDRVVLSGDHCQLPPTVVSQPAAAGGLGVSLFERLMQRYGPAVSHSSSGVCVNGVAATPGSPHSK